MADAPKIETPAIPTETPAPAAAPVVETPAAPVEAAPPSPDYPETLLERVSKEIAAEASPKAETPPPAEAEAKPTAEDAKPEGEKPAEAAPAEPPKPALEPIDYKYEVPEGFEISDERKGEFVKALDAFRENPAEGATGLLNLHQQAVAEAVNKVRSDQMEVFRNTISDWEKLILSDPEIGGSGHLTAMRAIARVRDAGVPQKDAADFEHFLRVTGAGSHPAFNRFLHNLAPFIDETHFAPADFLPPKDIGKAPKGAKRGESFYEHPRGETQ